MNQNASTHLKSKDNRYGFITILIILAAMVVLAACKTPEKKVEKDQENVTDAKQELNQAEKEYKSDMENFKKETNEKIEANQKSINDFNERVAKEKKEAREEYRKKIKALEEKNTDLKKRLDDYKEEGSEKWQSFKREFKYDMDELGTSISDFWKDNIK
ncbi:MAG TPA: hypothetical protein VN026_02260 [Bacteroidia bacterium]|jgi:hypothetical protein|nr:hypothetical protein [Bacteroidia bacterium]